MLNLKKGKLIFYFSESADIAIIHKIIDKVVASFSTIENYFKVDFNLAEVTLHSKENFDEFVASHTSQFGNKDNIPSWLVGFSINEGVHIVVPAQDKIDYMVKVTIHELVHFLAYKIPHKEKRVKLLDEGIACFLAGQMSAKRFDSIKQDYFNNALHKISDFCIYNGNEFGKLNGYAYSYYMMDFLNEQFGKEKIIHWLKYPEEFLNLVPNIENEFRQFLISKIND